VKKWFKFTRALEEKGVKQTFVIQELGVFVFGPG